MAGGIALGGSRRPSALKLFTGPKLAVHGSRPADLLRVHFQKLRFDRELAGGADPDQSAGLSRRARQLQSMRTRRSLARGIARDLEMINGPIDRDQVIEARSLLLELIERLRAPGVLSPRGVAMIRLLLSDASSPIFSPEWSSVKPEPGALERRVRCILAAFDGQTVDLSARDRQQG